MENKYGLEIKNCERYLDKFTSDNTRNGAITVVKKMDAYITYLIDKFDYNLVEHDLSSIQQFEADDVDLFIKRECSGKSETTISNTASILKDMFSFFNNESATYHLSLAYVRTITEVKENKYLTPCEIYECIEQLKNYQDKVLLLFCYLGLYDNGFETIRHIRKENFKPDNTLELDDGRVIELSDYSAEIIYGAIKETSCEKYVFSEGRAASPYKLNNDTPYIIKSKERKGAKEIVTQATLKKRFELISRVVEREEINPVTVKNSKVIYDMVKLEYDNNLGMDINQLVLKEICKEANVRGTIEKLNMSKKKLKSKIIKEIVDGKVVF